MFNFLVFLVGAVVFIIMSALICVAFLYSPWIILGMVYLMFFIFLCLLCCLIGELILEMFGF